MHLTNALILFKRLGVDVPSLSASGYNQTDGTLRMSGLSWDLLPAEGIKRQKRTTRGSLDEAREIDIYRPQMRSHRVGKTNDKCRRGSAFSPWVKSQRSSCRSRR